MDCLGRQIRNAVSSLTNFSCEFDDGQALVLDAIDDGSPKIQARLIAAQDMPSESDAVCRVDWGWITGATVEQSKITESFCKLILAPAGPLTISVQVWQGKPFLSFQPYRPAK